ncbi:MAG TPA: leucine--tRNA ligase [Ktedonobacterales bacterium]
MAQRKTTETTRQQQQQRRPTHAASKPAEPIIEVRPPQYPFASFEAKWSARWEASGIYQTDLDYARKPYYNLMMFPYPSAEGLHVGNMYPYTGSDIHGRWTSMRGYDVFEPIGFDAFGIHSENFAIKRGIHPVILTARSVAHFREEQLKRIGNRFDWAHELDTSDPRYYRWTQWIFIQLFKAGLAERKSAAVNWCPNDKTVLADEQVINGCCERCGALVERRELEQWFLKITKYADRLLNNLKTLDWSERVKTAQRNWIGRSEGLQFSMAVAGDPTRTIEAFTTRPDTIYGVTFVAFSPQHPLVAQITDEAHTATVTAYVEEANRQRPTDHAEEARPDTGAFTGRYAIHPLTGEQIPIWVASYVLMEYGTGAIMGVPAHDSRDMIFTQAMGLPIRTVVQPPSGDDVNVASDASDNTATNTASEAFTGYGVLANSGAYSGMTSDAASAAIIAEFEARGIGSRSVKYHLRDWLISRQRYWGPPIPIIYCPEHGAVPVPEDQLPVVLPYIENFRPAGTGVAPLASDESFVRTTCPICGGPARRETDVSDNFLDSAWYYLRYPSSDDDSEPWNPKMTAKWLPVSMYTGGAEHSLLHMLYSRFITMALHDLGHLPFEEPFPHFRANGTITRHGAKISKSKGNIINPDDYINRYGADVFRVYLMFLGPYEADADFSDRNISGVVRFLDRVWRIVTSAASTASQSKPRGEARREMHRTIQRMTEDTGAFKYNTAIATMMEYVNGLEARGRPTRAELRTLLKLLAPYTPFITEELWEHIEGPDATSIHTQSWPTFDPDALRSAMVTLVVQVNGRLRDRITVAADATEDQIRAAAEGAPNARRAIGGAPVRQMVVVPGRLVNIVTGQ